MKSGEALRVRDRHRLARFEVKNHLVLRAMILGTAMDVFDRETQ